MTHLRRLAARLRRALGMDDVLAIAGIGCLALGAWLVLPALGFVVLGLALLFVVRYGTGA